jgi:hypothetical protein
MPKQSDDLTHEGDEVQDTPKTKLKIPVPSRDQINSALRKATRRKAGAQPPQSPDPEKR